MFDKAIFLRLKWPVSVNNLYTRTGSRVVLTKKARDYYEQTKWDLWQQIKLQNIKNLPINETVQMFLSCYPPDKRVRDEGNLRKVIDDVLVKSGILRDDVLIKKITSEVHLFNEMSKNRGVEIKISSFTQSYGNI